MPPRERTILSWSLTQQRSSNKSSMALPAKKRVACSAGAKSSERLPAVIPSVAERAAASSVGERVLGEDVLHATLARFPQLSADQRRGLDAFVDGSNVFVTGSAGVGKTYLLGALIFAARSQLARKRTVYVTATTGVAAVALGGCTLDSFAGFYGDSVAPMSGTVMRRLASADVLFVDEVSLMSADKLTELDRRLRVSRHTPAVFGGVQVVFSGDFAQLPCVQGQVDSRQCNDDVYAFRSPVWQQLRFVNIHLRNSFRQSVDPEYFALLQRLRLCTADDIPYLREQLSRFVRPVPNEVKSHVVHLVSTRAQADTINSQHLRDFSLPEHTWTAKDHVVPGVSPSVLDNMPAPKTISLRQNVRVMLVQNMPDGVSRGLVNGLRGTVVGFEQGTLASNVFFAPRVLFDNGIELVMQSVKFTTQRGDEILASREQLPLILCRAITIHKSQGSTLCSCVCANLSASREQGQTYVALSRMRTSVDVYLSCAPHVCPANPAVIEFYRTME